MDSEKESRLHKHVVLPEYSLPLTILFDLRDFSSERLEQITKEANMLSDAAKSEYILSQPAEVRTGLEKAADNARWEAHWWYALETRLWSLCDDALTSEE